LHTRIRIVESPFLFQRDSPSTYSAALAQVKFRYRRRKNLVTYRRSRNRLLEAKQLLHFAAEIFELSATIKESSSRSSIYNRRSNLQKPEKDSSEEKNSPLRDWVSQ
jgi:hypothetical protein